jgi:hypothetical protein
MEISANNLAYWLRHYEEFDGETVEVLRAIKEGTLTANYPRRKGDGRFYVAFLIAMECVSFNPETTELKVTEKGEEAIEFFLPERKERR